MDWHPISTIIIMVALVVTPTGLPYPDSSESHYVAWAAVQAAEPGGDLTVTPENDQTGAEPETERESEIGNTGAVNSEAPTELEEFSDDTKGAPDAETDLSDFSREMENQETLTEEITTSRPYTSSAKVSLKLIGTAIADDPELSMAIIEIRGTRQQSYFREGAWVGDIRIKKILRNRLIVDYGEKEVKVAMMQSLPGEKETAAVASAPMADQGSVDRTASFQVAGNREPNAGRATGRQKFVHLDRAEIEGSLADVDQAMRQVSVQPVLVHNRPAGVRVSPLSPGSIFAQLGLRNEDVIVGVNGESITRPEQAAGFSRK
jgi:type II secretion system protein C